MTDTWRRAGRSAIASLENELIVRDFIAIFNEGDVIQLAPFLHPTVVFQAAEGAEIRGRRDVMRMCSEMQDAFEDVQLRVMHLAATETVVIAEQALRLTLPGEEPRWLMSFASYEIDDSQICTWRQLHG